MLMILSLCGCLGQPCFQSSLFQPASPKGPCSEVLLALALEAHHGLGSGRAPPQESHSPAFGLPGLAIPSSCNHAGQQGREGDPVQACWPSSALMPA